jgi:hypothetical protein
MMKRLVLTVAVLVFLAVALLWILGKGMLVQPWDAGKPTDFAVPTDVVEGRSKVRHDTATLAGVASPKQILFGDLHVHTTFSADAFQMALPLAGGDGAHPVGDACDFARYCSALDFWSINDHAITLTPQRWAQTVAAIRECNAVTDPAHPDVVAFLGWEWTQMGSTPENHYGHKNVILRDLDGERIPARPIAAGPPPGVPPPTAEAASTLGLGLLALFERQTGGMQIARYFNDVIDVPLCPPNVSVRNLPLGCREQATTPAELFAKLDDWGHEALVIPHGTTWGMYTPPGSSWDKQLTPQQHDADRQLLVEVFSGHGNSEEYRDWREVLLLPDGSRECPPPTENYLPECRRAGEIIRERCGKAGQSEDVCEKRAAAARQNYVDADRNAGHLTVPGATAADWQDSGQCRDCFQPSFRYRPRSSVQYMMSLARRDEDDKPLRFRFGFIASSDNHSARPGTGYKELARSEFTEARFGNFTKTVLGRAPEHAPAPESVPFDAANSTLPVFAIFETERGASYFLNGGLVAVHSEARTRNAIWDALRRKEVYGTSGPRILLWFDLVNAPGGAQRTPMGSEVTMQAAPRFEVRAAGSFEQQPGCPPYSTDALSSDRRRRLCRGECYNPSDRRRSVTRIEVVRIRTQTSPNEDVSTLIEDPWRVFLCPLDLETCRVNFSDEDFPTHGRDTLYYVRAVEEPGVAVGADPLGCERDDGGRCVKQNPCFGRPDSDDCLARTEERAWSSPIFVDFAAQ